MSSSDQNISAFGAGGQGVSKAARPLPLTPDSSRPTKCVSEGVGGQIGGGSSDTPWPLSRIDKRKIPTIEIESENSELIIEEIVIEEKKVNKEQEQHPHQQAQREPQKIVPARTTEQVARRLRLPKVTIGFVLGFCLLGGLCIGSALGFGIVGGLSAAVGLAKAASFGVGLYALLTLACLFRQSWFVSLLGLGALLATFATAAFVLVFVRPLGGAMLGTLSPLVTHVTLCWSLRWLLQAGGERNE